MPEPGPGLAALLFDHPAGDDDPLVHTATATRTAGEIRDAARALAERLDAAGVRRAGPDQPGDLVAVLVVDGPDTISAMFGIWLAGAVAVPVNPRAPQAERDRIVDALGVRALVTVGDGWNVEVRDPDAGTSPGRASETRAETGARARPVSAPDAAFVTWTSGTTGTPKPVVHTHTGYLELLDRVLGPLARDRRGDRPPSPNLVPVALTLNAGIYNVCFGLRAGAPLVLLPRFDTTEFAILVARHGIRSTVLPPAAIMMLNDDPTVTDLGPLRYVRSITAPLSPLQARRFHDRFGVVVLNGYGQAEIGEVIGWTAADARDHPGKIGAVGRPHPGVEIRIDAGSEAAAGATGELLVKPPGHALGIAEAGPDHRDDSGAEQQAALAGRVTADGFVRTGDLAHVDEDGFVWIDGRLGDVINRGGNKVFPDAVEEVLRLHDSVRDAAVVAVADERLGEVPHACLVLAEAEGPSATGDDVASDVDAALAAELDALCRDHLVAYKVPAAYHVVAALPRNEVGKVLRAQLVAMLSASRSETSR